MNFRQKIKENQVSNISIYLRDIHSVTHTCEDGQLQSDNDRKLGGVGVLRGHQGVLGV